MTEKNGFEELLASLGGGITPVRPLAGPWKAALVLFPYCGLLTLVALAGFGIGNPTGWDPGFFWGATALELACAYRIFVLVRDESTPGEGRGTTSRALAASGALALQVAVGLASFARVPNGGMPDVGAQAELFCAAIRLVSAIGLVALTFWWTFHGLTLRPVATGWLGAAGTAIAIDAVWRLQCSRTSPHHFLLGHTAPLILLVALATLLHWIFATRRRFPG